MPVATANRCQLDLASGSPYLPLWLRFVLPQVSYISSMPHVLVKVPVSTCQILPKNQVDRACSTWISNLDQCNVAISMPQLGTIRGKFCCTPCTNEQKMTVQFLQRIELLFRVNLTSHLLEELTMAGSRIYMKFISLACSSHSYTYYM